MSETLIFLPGASGNLELWQPVAKGLRHPGRRLFMAWPGFGGVPIDPAITGIDDLVDRVVAAISAPVALFAQSMGGVIAIRAALERPAWIKHLVLAVTSGGLDVAALGGQDWRPSYLDNYPKVPRWFIDEHHDLTGRLCDVSVPVLLLWGDNDPISPVAVGERLAELLPRAELVVIKGGTHDLVSERADDVIPIIQKHLAAPAGGS